MLSSMRRMEAKRGAMEQGDAAGEVRTGWGWFRGEEEGGMGASISMSHVSFSESTGLCTAHTALKKRKDTQHARK